MLSRQSGFRSDLETTVAVRRKRSISTLASMQFRVGDLLTLSVTARDAAGQESTSDELHVLISPHSVDLDSHERIDEFSAAARFASTLVDELEAAGKAIDESDAHKDHQSPEYLTASANGSRHLTSASEAGDTDAAIAVARHGSYRFARSFLTALSYLDRQGPATVAIRRRSVPPRRNARRNGRRRQGKIRHAIEQSHELYAQEVRTSPPANMRRPCWPIKKISRRRKPGRIPKMKKRPNVSRRR